MERKPSFVVTLFLLVISCWQLDDSAAVFGGAWCPYKIDKLIPCRVHNGTEKYLGPNICWKSINGSFSCTKRMRVRPKFVTTYKKVSETIYKCCPGLQGPHCQNECFNCSTLRQMESRLGYLETKINQIHVFPGRGTDEEKEPFGSGQDRDVKNSISDDDDDGDLEDVLAILHDLRTLKTRMFQVETQLVRLKHSVDELMKLKSELSSSTTTTTVPTTIEQQSIQKRKSHPEEDETTVRTAASTITQKSISAGSAVSRETSPNEQSAVRLEANLERGDIASTLNDDYGEDVILSASSTEEYADQLYAHESSLNNA